MGNKEEISKTLRRERKRFEEVSGETTRLEESPSKLSVDGKRIDSSIPFQMIELITVPLSIDTTPLDNVSNF